MIRCAGCVACVVAVLSAALPSAWSQMPERLGFQGRLTDQDGAPLEGPVTLTFRLYNAETEGDEIWSETKTGVTVSGGLFGVSLGAAGWGAADFSVPYWMSVQAGADAEMAPRYALTASPYAMWAKRAAWAADADRLDGLDSTDFAPRTGSDQYVQVQSSSAQAGSFWIAGSGALGVLSLDPAYRLDVAGAGRFTGTVSGADPTGASHFVTKGYADSHYGLTGGGGGDVIAVPVGASILTCSPVPPAGYYNSETTIVVPPVRSPPVSVLGWDRTDGAAVVANRTIYVLGGEISTGVYNTIVERYDPVANTWSGVTALLTPRKYLAAAAFTQHLKTGVEELLFAMGGDGAHATVNECYNITTGTWSAKAALPEDGKGMAVFNLGSDLYAVFQNGTCYRYVVSLNQWDRPTFTGDSPIPGFEAAAAVGMRIFLFRGGLDSPSTWEYDCARLTRTIRADVPDTDDAGWRAAVLNGRIILVGGYPNNDGFRFVYSVWNNTWASESFGGSLRKHAVVAFNNCIYVIGGAGTTQDPNAVTSFSPQQVFYVHTLFE